MPILIHPGSDEDRLRLLETTVAQDTSDLAASNPQITAETRALIVARKGPFASAFSGIAMFLGLRVKEVTESQRADGKVTVYIRDFWEVIKRRTYRMEHNIAVLAFYGLPQDGSVPPLSSRADLVTAATNIATGETNAVAGGFPAMANPSAAEVAAKFAIAQAERAEVGPADAAYDAAQATIASLREGIDEVIDDIIADIKYKNRKLDEASIRRILRRYGIEFEYTAGETPDPEDPPAGGGTPPTP